MNIQTPLFDGQLVRLGPIDFENDPVIESRWTHHPDFLRSLTGDWVYPRSPEQIKKQYEATEKECEDSKSQYYFAIRLKEDDRLLGFATIYWIQWNHGTGIFRLAIGDPADRQKGYGGEALAMLLRFCFNELNLYRLSTVIAEYNLVAQQMLEKAGFKIEVIRREALHRDGRRWDFYHYGLLAQDWRQQ